MKYSLDLKKYAALARRTAAEGCVLLENREGALPLKKGAKTAVFGRAAFNYYKSGLGSGGLVNTRYTTGQYKIHGQYSGRAEKGRHDLGRRAAGGDL